MFPASCFGRRWAFSIPAETTVLQPFWPEWSWRGRRWSVGPCAWGSPESCWSGTARRSSCSALLQLVFLLEDFGEAHAVCVRVGRYRPLQIETRLGGDPASRCQLVLRVQHSESESAEFIRWAPPAFGVALSPGPRAADLSPFSHSVDDLNIPGPCRSQNWAWFVHLYLRWRAHQIVKRIGFIGLPKPKTWAEAAWACSFRSRADSSVQSGSGLERITPGGLSPSSATRWYFCSATATAAGLGHWITVVPSSLDSWGSLWLLQVFWWNPLLGFSIALFASQLHGDYSACELFASSTQIQLSSAAERSVEVDWGLLLTSINLEELLGLLGHSSLDLPRLG